MSGPTPQPRRAARRWRWRDAASRPSAAAAPSHRPPGRAIRLWRRWRALILRPGQATASPLPLTPQPRRRCRTSYRAPLPTAAPSEATNGRDLARERRAGQSRTGAQGRPSGRVRRPGHQTFVSAPLSATASLTEPDPLGQEPSRTDEPGTSESDRLLDTICSLADAAPADDGLPASVRELCRQRRQNLSRQGQAALPGSPRSQVVGRGSARVRAGAAAPLASVRDLARQRRADWARTAAVLRPTIGPAAGCALPRRPRSSSAPPSRVAP